MGSSSDTVVGRRVKRDKFPVCGQIYAGRLIQRGRTAAIEVDDSQVGEVRGDIERNGARQRVAIINDRRVARLGYRGAAPVRGRTPVRSATGRKSDEGTVFSMCDYGWT